MLRPNVAAQSYAKRRVTLPPPVPARGWARLGERLRGRLGGGDRLVRARARIRTLAPPGAPLEDPRDDARVMLFLLGPERDADPVAYRNVVRTGGTEPVKEDALLTAMPATVDAFDIVFMNRFSDGAFRLVDADVRGVHTTPAYLGLAATLVVGWAGFAAATAWVLVRRGGAPAALVLAVPLAGILVGVTLPETVDLSALRGGFASAVASVAFLEDLDFGILYKLGHFGFFLVAAALASALRHRFGTHALATAGALGLLALATEGLQLHLHDRTERASDLLIDGAGIALGTWFGIASQRLASRFPYNRRP